MSVTWPFSARIQPFSETTTVIGSRSTHRLEHRLLHRRLPAHRRSSVRRLPSGVSGPKVFRTSLISSAIASHCFSSDLSSASIPFPSLVSVRMLAPDLELLELAEAAEPHVEDRLGLHVRQLEALHQDRLRLVLGPDDADHLVEVEIGDEVAVEHLEPVADLVEAELRPPQQHLAPVRQPLVEHLAERPSPAARGRATGR